MDPFVDPLRSGLSGTIFSRTSIPHLSKSIIPMRLKAIFFWMNRLYLARSVDHIQSDSLFRFHAGNRWRYRDAFATSFDSEKCIATNAPGIAPCCTIATQQQVTGRLLNGTVRRNENSFGSRSSIRMRPSAAPQRAPAIAGIKFGRHRRDGRHARRRDVASRPRIDL